MKETIKSLALIFIPALICIFTVDHLRSKHKVEVAVLNQQLVDTQNRYTASIDSLKRIARQSDSTAAVWRETARALGSRSDSLQHKIATIRGSIIKVKDDVNALPDSVLVQRFYRTLR